MARNWTGARRLAVGPDAVSDANGKPTRHCWTIMPAYCASAQSAAKPKQLLTAINRFLFTELGFRGDENNYYDPDNSYLNRVMDRRQGNPISLC